jgi:hypothetical protein
MLSLLSLMMNYDGLPIFRAKFLVFFAFHSIHHFCVQLKLKRKCNKSPINRNVTYCRRMYENENENEKIENLREIKLSNMSTDSGSKWLEYNRTEQLQI